MEASDEMGKRERRYPVLLYLLAIPLMIPVVRLALLAFPMIPRFYQGFLPFRQKRRITYSPPFAASPSLRTIIHTFIYTCI